MIHVFRGQWGLTACQRWRVVISDEVTYSRTEVSRGYLMRIKARFSNRGALVVKRVGVRVIHSTVSYGLANC
jgi:hypothetical protein